jgi:ribonuclease PH
MGNTQVICGVGIEDSVPRWMQKQKVEGGWLTAEYSMLPYSTEDRSRRENSGRISGRTQEIQRLIGRSLRAVMDLKKLGPRTLYVDCDVLQADGGTRTASVTGAYVALRIAVNYLLDQGLIFEDPILEEVAAISVGLVKDSPCLDLCYVEDVAADVDMNVVMTASGKFIEVQGTAEGEPFDRAQLDALTQLAEGGINDLVALQRKAVE